MKAVFWMKKIGKQKMFFVYIASLLCLFCDRKERDKEVKALLLFCRMMGWDKKKEEGINEQNAEFKGRNCVILDVYCDFLRRKMIERCE